MAKSPTTTNRRAGIDGGSTPSVVQRAPIVWPVEVRAGLALWFARFKPKTRPRLSEWSRKNARLDDGSRFHSFPYQDGIADAMSDPEIPDVTVMKSARVGYTQLVKNFFGWSFDQRPRDMIAYFPRLEDAKKFSRKELKRVLEWPSTRRNFTYAGRDPKNTLRQKEFPGGSLLLNGTNAPGEFRADTAQVVVCEEVDGYQDAAEDEGDPLDLAWKRTETADEPKRLAGSTPKRKGHSRIATRFEEGTQEHRYLPCPHCGTMQRLVFGDGTGPGLRWEPKNTKRPVRVWYRCAGPLECDIEEHYKASMDAAGEWRAHAPQNWPHRSFHIWTAYSQHPGAAWIEIVRNFLLVKGNPTRLKTWVNQTLGETYEERGEAPTWRRLYERREAWKPRTVPRYALVLLGGIDVQKDRVELFVWGFGRDMQSWLVDHVVVPGNPFLPAVWTEVSKAIRQTYPHEMGAEMHMLRIGADTGYATTMVEGWARKHPGLVVPIKGANTVAAPPFVWGAARQDAGGGKRKRGLRLGLVGKHVLTLELYGFLGLDPPTDEEAAEGVVHSGGYVHLNGLATEEICKQLVGNEWVEKRGEWMKLHATEALDCWRYARAMWTAMRLDAWRDRQWRELADMLGHVADTVVPEEPAPVAAVVPRPAAPPAPPAVRRVGRSSYLSRGGR